ANRSDKRSASRRSDSMDSVHAASTSSFTAAPPYSMMQMATFRMRLLTGPTFHGHVEAVDVKGVLGRHLGGIESVVVEGVHVGAALAWRVGPAPGDERIPECPRPLTRQ